MALFNAVVCICLPKILMLLSSNIMSWSKGFSGEVQEVPTAELAQRTLAL
ncbi:MAG: hypothetical protein KME25_34540 [Symplocastrum torsivum CPER-KK1]|uniref:Uncharacterized protein n=1 Tax=Symplocastrum torsivum CPER-KK1 TaxID=450513 RepID=A0A951UDH4_9CYAN|nr:hypothetical protein [Symplocastrum torsivum CPER-KK1]